MLTALVKARWVDVLGHYSGRVEMYDNGKRLPFEPRLEDGSFSQCVREYTEGKFKIAACNMARDLGATALLYVIGEDCSAIALGSEVTP